MKAAIKADFEHLAFRLTRAAAQKAQRERAATIAQQTRDRELSALRFKVARQEGWQRNVDAAARNAMTQRHRQTLLTEIDQMVNPPPEPEPVEQVVYVEQPSVDELGNDDSYRRSRGIPWR